MKNKFGSGSGAFGSFHKNPPILSLRLQQLFSATLPLFFIVMEPRDGLHACGKRSEQQSAQQQQQRAAERFSGMHARGADWREAATEARQASAPPK